MCNYIIYVLYILVLNEILNNRSYINTNIDYIKIHMSTYDYYTYYKE